MQHLPNRPKLLIIRPSITVLRLLGNLLLGVILVLWFTLSTAESQRLIWLIRLISIDHLRKVAR